MRVNSELERTKNELQKKFSETAQYETMRKVLVTKNEQIKDLRKRLKLYVYQHLSIHLIIIALSFIHLSIYLSIYVSIYLSQSFHHPFIIFINYFYLQGTRNRSSYTADLIWLTATKIIII